MNPTLHRCTNQVLSDIDSVETASLTSQSSAYFSLTPTLGSVTELSDTTSLDSFNEYDFKGKNGVGIVACNAISKEIMCKYYHEFCRCVLPIYVQCLSTPHITCPEIILLD